MPTVPLRNNITAVADDDESQSGIESESGIFTTDGQSTVNPRGMQGGGGGAGGGPLLDTVRAYDTTFDESLVSGIDDASFILNESSLYRAKVREEEKMVRDEYSLDESSLDLADYVSMRNNYRNAGTTSNLNVSTDAMAPTTNPSFLDDTIFSGAYNRVLKTFMFQGNSSSNKRAVETSDEESQGKTTPKTLSPKDSENNAENDDDGASNDANSAGRPQTMVYGKAPRTPQKQGGKQAADTPRTVSSTVLTSVSDTKILGLRLSRLVIIVLFVLVAAVAVAVGSAVASQKKESSSNRGSAGFGAALFPTNSPVVATIAPTQFVAEGNGADIQDQADDTSTPTAAPIMATSAPIMPTLFPLIMTRVPTIAPSVSRPTAAPFAPPTNNPTIVTTAPTIAATNFTTLAPTLNETAFPVDRCGGDNDALSFTLFGQERDCIWFR